MKKKTLLYIVIALIILIAGLYYISIRKYSLYGNPIKSVTIRNTDMYLEVVRDREKMEKGLGKRAGICEDCGMLFVFAKTGKYSFWMKDMQFPLDILWLLDGRIVKIEKNVQPSFAGVLVPSEEANAVLEVNASKSEELSLKIGDMVR
jgi:uncharacterized membrane protein (UPF0127 family)